jgi:hypothetical protein
VELIARAGEAAQAHGFGRRFEAVGFGGGGMAFRHGVLDDGDGIFGGRIARGFSRLAQKIRRGQKGSAYLWLA